MLQQPLNSCGDSIRTRCSAPAAVPVQYFRRTALTCRLIMVKGLGVVDTSAMRVLLAGFSAGIVVIG